MSETSVEPGALVARLLALEDAEAVYELAQHRLADQPPRGIAGIRLSSGEPSEPVSRTRGGGSKAATEFGRSGFALVT